MKKKKKQIKNKVRIIQVKEADGKIKKIGKYDEDKNTFYTERDKTTHFMRKYNAWGLDLKTVEFLAQRQAKVHVKDKESKWEYECYAKDFILYGKEYEYNQHRPQYFLNIEKWQVVKAKACSQVIKCDETDCKHNFGRMCFRGVVTINSKGECAGYEDRD